jgi:hypothetical protein
MRQRGLLRRASGKRAYWHVRNLISMFVGHLHGEALIAPILPKLVRNLDCMGLRRLCAGELLPVCVLDAGIVCDVKKETGHGTSPLPVWCLVCLFRVNWRLTGVP